MKKIVSIFSLLFCLMICFCCACSAGVKATYVFYQISYIDSANSEQMYTKEQVEELSYNENLPDTATEREKAENNIAMIKDYLDFRYVFYNDNTLETQITKDSDMGDLHWKYENNCYVIYGDDEYSVKWEKDGEMIFNQSEMSGIKIKMYLIEKK